MPIVEVYSIGSELHTRTKRYRVQLEILRLELVTWCRKRLRLLTLSRGATFNAIHIEIPASHRRCRVPVSVTGTSFKRLAPAAKSLTGALIMLIITLHQCVIKVAEYVIEKDSESESESESEKRCRPRKKRGRVICSPSLEGPGETSGQCRVINVEQDTLDL
eukprot:sb/3472737/